jgi:hypothetical protein
MFRFAAQYCTTQYNVLPSPMSARNDYGYPIDSDKVWQVEACCFVGELNHMLCHCHQRAAGRADSESLAVFLSRIASASDSDNGSQSLTRRLATRGPRFVPACIPLLSVLSLCTLIPPIPRLSVCTFQFGAHRRPDVAYSALQQIYEKDEKIPSAFATGRVSQYPSLKPPPGVAAPSLSLVLPPPSIVVWLLCSGKGMLGSSLSYVLLCDLPCELRAHFGTHFRVGEYLVFTPVPR